MYTHYTQSFSRKFVCLTAFLVSFFIAHLDGYAQLSGGSTYTINGTNNYPSEFRTFGGFVNFLNTQGTTGSGQIIVEITSAHVDSVIPVLSVYPGMAASRPILLKPAASNSVTISTTATLGTNSYLFRLNGTDFFTINGSNNGTNSQDLTWLIPSANGSTSTAIIGLAASTDSCVQDTIKNCIFIGGKNGLSNANAGIYTFAAIYNGGAATVPSASTANNNRNAFINNLIKGVRYGLYLRGIASGTKNNMCLISGNTLGANNTWEYIGGNNIASLSNSAGIFMAAYSLSRITANSIGWHISNNSSGYGFSGVQITNTGQVCDNLIIDGNNIFNLSYTGSGGWGTYGIRANIGSQTASNIAIVNNMISGIKTDGYSAQTGTFIAAGIFLEGTSTNSGVGIYYNSINMFGNTLGSSGSSSAGHGACIAIASGITGGTYMSNNLFKNTMGRTPGQSTTNNVYGLLYQSTSTTTTPFAVISNNSYHVSAGAGANTVYGFFKNAAQNTYSSLISATGETSSQNVNPNYTDSTDLHLNYNSTTATLLESGGTTISGISKDFDNQTRPGPTSTNGGGTNPDIGADEKDMKPVTGINVGVSVLVSPTPSQIGCGNSSVTITVRVKNYSGTGTIDASVDTIPVKVVITGPNAQTFSLSKVSGTLAPGATFDTTLTATYNMAAAGTYSFKSFTEYGADGDKSNDTLASSFSFTKISSFPNIQDFTGGTQPSGWTVAQVGTQTGTAANWLFASSLTNPTLSSQFGGGVAYFNSFSSSSGNQARLITPCFDFSSLTAPKADVFFSSDDAYPSNLDSVYLEVSTDGGVTYTIAGGYRIYDAASTTDQWKKVTFSLSSYAGQTVKIGFRGVSKFGNNIGIERVKIYEPSPYDIQAFALAAPTSSYYGTNKTIKFRFKNVGTATIDFSTNNLVVTSSVTGPNPATFSTVTISSDSLMKDSTLDVTVSTTADLSATGSYTFRFKGTLTTDGDNTNDSTGVTINVVFPLDYAITRTTGNTFSSIMSSGTSFGFTGSNGDDQTSPAITMPFTFSYQGQTVSSFKACTNGWMTLNGANVTSSTFTNSIAGNSATQNAILAAYWDDLVTTGYPTGYTAGSNLDVSMKYRVTGTSPNRVLTVEWAGMEKYNAPGPNLNFQIKLYETSNNIEYVYGQMDQFDGSSISEFSYSMGMNSFTTATAGVDEVLSLQEANSDIFSATPKNDLSASISCNTTYSFVPGTHGSGTAAAAITNDECSGAIGLSVNTDAPSDYCEVYRTEGATASASIPSCGAAAPGNADDDVWFSFDITSTKSVQVDLRSSSAFDGVFQVFSGTCGSLTSLACINKTGTSLTEDTILYNLTAGTYYIRVYHSGTGISSSATGKGNFGIYVYDAPIAPTNDNITGAQPLASGTSCVLSTTQKTTYANASSQTVCTGTATKDVWYRFKAGYANHTITVTPVTPGVTFNPVVQIFNLGTTFDTANAITGNQVVCQNNAGTNASEVVSFTGYVPGNFYAIRVYHALGGAGGTGKFKICIANPAGSWGGSLSQVWNDPGNWSDGIVPNASKNVRIGVGRPLYPIIFSSVACNNFQMDNGGDIEITSGGTLNINGAVTFTAGATWTNTSGTTVLNAATNIPNITYNALKLMASTGTYTMLGNTTVNNVLTIGGASTVATAGYTLDCKNDIVNNGTVSGTGKIVSSRASGYATISGTSAATYNNIEINTSATGGARIVNNSQINGTLILTQGTLVINNGAAVTVGSTSTSTGNITTATNASILAGSSATNATLAILGDASAPQITNFKFVSAGNFTLNRPNGLVFGSNCQVGKDLRLMSGTLNQNGFNLNLGNLSTSNLTIYDSVGTINNGGATGSLNIYGNVSAAAISGLRIDSVNQMVVNFPAGITLGSNFFVRTNASITKGDVTLNGKTVTLGSSATITEAGGQNFVGSTGSITTTRTYASNLTNLNIGGMGLKLTTTSAPGSTTVTRSHNIYTTSGSSIARNYSLTVGSAVTASYFELNYDSTELNGADRSKLRINKSTNSGSTWSNIVACNPTTAANLTGYVAKTNVALSGTILFTASDSVNTPLSPVFVMPTASHSISYTSSVNAVYPNPFADQLTVDFTSATQGSATVRLIDVNGKVVYSTNVSTTEGKNLLSINGANLSAGVYIMTLINGADIKTVRVVKQ